MNTDEEIFQLAAALSAAERPVYLDVSCAGQPEIRARVEALLRSHDAPGFMAAGTRDAHSSNAAENGGRSRQEARSVERIGRYRLIQEIGHGGFGIVYTAEQKEPVRRRVALKVLKRGMDTREIVTRFAMERQALALMDHQNVAMVFDGGETEDGRPYFVMEYVDGIPITRFCDDHRMSINERIELMIQVCRGLQHSHQKGLIHCDVKPANILVMMQDGRAIPKLIDFGIAKATTFLTIGTLIQDPAKWAGTPVYMSPEQLRRDSLDVDVRTDIYSSGALLYELLTGLTPFDHGKLMAEGFGRMEQTIREEDPPRPSAQLAAEKENLNKTAENRGTTPARLKSSLRQELDWIVMRAMEKNRERRYQSALELADDLNRYLKGEPVKAGPPTMRYRASKFTRRHSGRLSAAVAVLLVSVGMIAYHLVSKRNEQEALTISNRKEQEAHAVEMLTRSGAETDALPFYLANIKPHLASVADQLKGIALDTKREDRDRLHAAIAVLPLKSEVLAVLIEGLLKLDPTDAKQSEALEVFLVKLKDYQKNREVEEAVWDDLKKIAWKTVDDHLTSDVPPGEKVPQGKSPALAAAAVLAKLDASDSRWKPDPEGGLMRKAVEWAGPARAPGLSHFREFVDEVQQPVTFHDKVLQEKMSDLLGGTDKRVMDFDLLALPEFEVESKQKVESEPVEKIRNLIGLESAVNLKRLDLDFNDIDDLSPLSRITRMEELDLQQNRITDIRPLKGMKQLKCLDLRKQNIEASEGGRQLRPFKDLSALKNLSGLEELQLSGNDLSKIENLKDDFGELPNLEILEMENCQLTDISFVAGLPKLKILKLKNNKIKDVAPIAGLEKLKLVDISDNEVEDPLPLLDLVNFHRVSLVVEPNPLRPDLKARFDEERKKR